MEIKNLKKAAERIKKAAKNKEKIILYGDADLDGAASVIILEEAIKNLGGKITAIYFPDRESEGYGVTETALRSLKKFAPSLLIALDLGIGNVEEIKKARKLGFETIIIDHHEVLEKLPPAEIIVDPKQKGDGYPLKNLANAAIVFKLVEVLLGKKLTKNLKNNFMELVALATIADMIPRESENIIYIEDGLRSIKNSWRPGIKAFFEVEYFNNFPGLEQKISKMISILNVRDVENNLPASFRLLNFSSLSESKKLIEKLIDKNEIRHKKIEKTVEIIEEKLLGKDELVIFEGGSQWDFGTISPVASILCNKYKKPTFIFKKSEKTSQGSVRSPRGIDAVALMKKCKEHLLAYGGHPPAAGFKIKNENLENFKECLIKNLPR